MKCDKLKAITGQWLMFIGTNSKSWTTDNFTRCAAWCQQMKVDTVLLKVADGYERWYGGLNGYNQLRNIFLKYGVGCIPYTWMYGNTYGKIDTEIDILTEYIKSGGIVCADMETEWNGHADWCSHLAGRMQTVNGTFAVSTWADPDRQSWLDNVHALKSVVDIWMPQVYSNALDGMVDQYASLVDCLQPTVMIDPTNWAGPNNPVSIATRAYHNGHTALSIWHYDNARANETLCSAIFNAFPKQPVTEPVPAAPKTVNIQMSTNIMNSLNEEWNMSIPYFTATKQPPPAFNQQLAIVQKWTQCALSGRKLGPPMSVETKCHDWNNNEIIVMLFMGGRIEYDYKTCRVFTSNGEIVV